MTEEQIERQAERKMDSLDRRYMASELTLDEYDAGIDAINAECNKLYREMRAAALGASYHNERALNR